MPLKLYNLYRKFVNKKRELVMTDSLVKVKQRKDALAQSYKRQRVLLEIEDAVEDEEKFKKTPDDRWYHYTLPSRPKRG